MKMAYFRKSERDFDAVLDTLKKGAEGKGWKVLGELNIGEKGKVVGICKSKWLERITSIDHQLTGLLPCSFYVLKKEGKVIVGSGDPSVLGAIGQNKELSTITTQMEDELKGFVNEAAGVDELKPGKVVLYATMSCPYCKMEESWLKEKGIEHEMVYVDHNRKKAEEMVKKTGQMGVPVTEIQYEDSEPEFIIGFNKLQLTNILGV
jgi:glutaredoxin 3